jgi:glycosyltransferase involved in cell wall biosynthesis
MFVMNPVVRDPRVTREAQLLANKGFPVTVIGLSEESRKEFMHNGYRVILIGVPLLFRKAIAMKRASGSSNDLSGQSKSGNRGALNMSRIKGNIFRGIVDLGEIAFNLWNSMVMFLTGVRLKALIYHSHDLDTLLCGYGCSRINGAKLVYDFHEAYTEQFSPGTKTRLWRRFYGLLERVFVNSADAKVTVCNSLGNWAQKQYNADNVEVVMNVSGYTAPCVTGKTAAMKTVLYHGGFCLDRGIEQLILSFRYIEGARLVLRGWGPIEDNLKRLISAEGLEKKISIVPPVKMEELVQHAAEADIGVIPYIATNLNNRFTTPNKLFEYMMAGLAIAGSDLPELNAIILGNNLGRVFNPEDPEDIAKALNEMLKDNNMLADMKNNSLFAAREKYNWEKEGQKLLSLYEKICAA